MDLLDGTRQFGTQRRPMKAAHMAQLARHAIATDVGIAKNATDKEQAHAGSERSPICHAFHDIRPSYALPLPDQAATLDPLSSPPGGEGHLSDISMQRGLGPAGRSIEFPASSCSSNAVRAFSECSGTCQGKYRGRNELRHQRRRGSPAGFIARGARDPVKGR